MNFLTTVLEKLRASLLPSTCVLCASLSRRAIDLCAGCENDLPWLTNVCSQCALPIAKAEQNQAMICGRCLQQQPPFVTTEALFYYQPPIDQFIAQLKFQNQLLYARLLGELLAQRLQKKYCRQLLPDCIVPVPLHPVRLRERGFNQALELTRVVAKKLALPVEWRACRRSKFTAAQSGLPAEQRYQNIKNAFQITGNLTYKHVAVIDDVVTTGHTVTEFSKTLKKAGVERIDVWCVARTAK